MTHSKMALGAGLVLVVAATAATLIWTRPAPAPVDAVVKTTDTSENVFAEPRRDQGQSQQNAETLENLKADLLQLEAQLAALQYAQEQQAQNIHRPRQNRLAQAKERPTPEQADRQVEQQVQRQQSLYEAQLMSEAVDMEWADATLAKVETALISDEFKGLDFVEGNCGATLCRVKLSANQNVPMEESLQKLSVDRPWNGPTFVSMDSMGNVSLFFARDGHQLPTEELL
ncbi:hypothetical protein [Ketobacter sp.]|uniref:hypothetical protein n=1 Tax=Ketobacter sp. TaxID=2083498 RepID=UPI0025C3F7E3|nr:hypothetical protein [Ketobacter sp.]